VFDWVVSTLSNSDWTYAAVAVIVVVDAVFPLMPGDAATITAAILAAQGRLSIVLVVAVGWIAAATGDNVSYLAGQRLGRRAAQRLFRTDRARDRLEWAREQIDRRGITLIVAARFVPGGRTATTFAAGTLEMPWRRFIVGDVIGTFGWSLFTAMLGYAGGTAFQRSLWEPLLLSAAVSVLVILAGELWERRAMRESSARSAARGRRTHNREQREISPVEEEFARLGQLEVGR